MPLNTSARVVGYSDAFIDAAEWPRFADLLGADYVVGAEPDWALTAVAGQVLTIRVAAGRGLGGGIGVELKDPETRAATALASGVRYDTVVMRHTWRTVNKSDVVIIPGTSVMQVAAGLSHTPGDQDDQVIGLIKITAGQSVPEIVKDWRVWGSKVFQAKDLAAFGTPAFGQEVVVDGTRYRGGLDAQNLPTFLPVSALTPAAQTYWAATTSPLTAGWKKATFFTDFSVQLRGLLKWDAPTSTLTVLPGGRGLYLVSAAAIWEANTSGLRGVGVYRNLVPTPPGSPTQVVPAATSGVTQLRATDMMELADGDALSLAIYHTASTQQRLTSGVLGLLRVA